MSDEERRHEGLHGLFIADDEDRRNGGEISVEYDKLWHVLQEIEAGKRAPQPRDRLGGWLESAFWHGYNKDYPRLALFRCDIRERFGGQPIRIEPHNVTSSEIARLLRELGVQRTFIAGKGRNGDA
jgi:hypothetical protein